VVLSTGYATLSEIESAVDALQDTEVMLLHCVGSYPTESEEANLQIMNQLRDSFDTPVGYSDHTVGVRAAEIAIANGAQLVEKHFTLSKNSSVGDHELSANPEEMKTIVEFSRSIPNFFSKKSRRTKPLDVELSRRDRMRRSLATNTSLSAGEKITESKLTALRPEGNISPSEIDSIIGRRAVQDLEKFEPLTEDKIE
jgi:sialic acid synthase SpsE